MTAPLIAAHNTTLYSDYWRTAGNAAVTAMLDRRSVKVFSGRDSDLEAGFQPRLEAVFATKAEAEAYVASWEGLYDEVQFWVA